MMTVRTLMMAACVALIASCSDQASGPVQGENAPSRNDAVNSHADHDHAGPVSITARAAEPIAVGKPATLTLRLTDQKGQPIVAADMRRNHDHLLHVMVVDTGLEDYAHAHPTANPDGTFSFTFTPQLDRPYRLWADFQLGQSEVGGAAGQTGDHDHSDSGHSDHGESIYAATDIAVGAAAVPTFAARQSLRAEAGGLRFQLSLPGALQAGEATQAQLAVVGADGQPFTQLEPLMGAFGHIVGFNPGATTMMHVHPEGAEPANAAARGGPVISFTLEPETVGPQRLFVQVKANGAEVIVPFTVIVGQ